MRRDLWFSTLLLLGLLLASCARSADPLAGTAWTLVSLDGEALVAGTSITLEFGGSSGGYRADTVHGSSGCNTYGGDYTLAGTQLEFAELASTAMGCDAPILDREAAYFSALGVAATYRLSDDGLELTNCDSGEVLSFTRAP